MKIYFATVDTFENESVMTTPYRGILCSYYYFKNNELTYDLKSLIKKRLNDPSFHVFIDSGAFSAHACTGGIINMAFDFARLCW